MNYIKEKIETTKYKGQSLTHVKMADLVGCSTTDISNYIAMNRTPNHERLIKMTKILKCKITDLYPNAKRVVSYDLGLGE